MEIVSVNIGRSAVVRLGTASVRTGIFKQPVRDFPVWVGRQGLAGDMVCDQEHHGGLDQAVYVYGQLDYDWWSHELGREILPGTFGENLTITEFESAACRVGDRFETEALVLEVTAPRIPCGKFSARMEDPQFVKRFRSAERPGVYCRVITEGMAEVGTAVRFQPYAGPSVSIIELCRDFYDPNPSVDVIRRFLAAPVAERIRRQKESRLRLLTESRVDRSESN